MCAYWFLQLQHSKGKKNWNVQITKIFVLLIVNVTFDAAAWLLKQQKCPAGDRQLFSYTHTFLPCLMLPKTKKNNREMMEPLTTPCMCVIWCLNFIDPYSKSPVFECLCIVHITLVIQYTLNFVNCVNN